MDCQEIRDDLLDVLYGEADASARRRVTEHQRTCRDCHQELVALQRLRKDLATWTLPPSASTVPARRWARWLPVAAGLLLGVGGLTAAHLQSARLQERVARLERESRAHVGPGNVRPASDPDDARVREAALLGRLERLLGESEARQQHRLDAELAAIEDRHQARRRYDLAQVSAGLSYLEGKTGLQMARTTELMGHVLQAAQER